MKARQPGIIKSTLARWLFSDYPFPAGAGDGIAYNSRPYAVPDGDVILRLSAVWACVRLLSETISTLPLALYQRLPNGDRVLAVDHPLYGILQVQPNADMTAQTFWEVTLNSLLLRGNAFAEKKYVGLRLVALNFLNPKRVSWDTRMDGSLEFRYVDLAGKMRVIPEHLMFHTLGFTLDGRLGLSVIRHGSGVFMSALAAQKAANTTFEKGLMPTVGFKMAQILKKEQRKEFREDFKQEVGGAMNAGKPFLLEGGMEAVSIGIDPSDAQLLESRGFSVEEICRWFRVPPFMVGHAEKSTSWGTGLEQQQIGFLTFALRPWLKRIEQSIQRSLLTPAEKGTYFAEFAIEGLLRADSSARSKLYASALNNGWMCRDEVRRMENLPPLKEGGDVFTVQSALVAIDKLGEVPAAASAQDALKQWLGLAEEKEETP